MQDDDDDDDDDNDVPMILNNRAKNHTSERTIVPWTVIFNFIAQKLYFHQSYGMEVVSAFESIWTPESINI